MRATAKFQKTQKRSNARCARVFQNFEKRWPLCFDGPKCETFVFSACRHIVNGPRRKWFGHFLQSAVFPKVEKLAQKSTEIDATPPKTDQTRPNLFSSWTLCLPTSMPNLIEIGLLDQRERGPKGFSLGTDCAFLPTLSVGNRKRKRSVSATRPSPLERPFFTYEAGFGSKSQSKV